MTRAPAWMAGIVAAGLAAAGVQAGVVFDRTTVDVGEVRSGQPLARAFSFRNDGTEPVEIVGLRTACGCLKPRLDKRSYAPGEGGQLTLEVHTLSQTEGPHAWPLVVTARTGDQSSETTLELRARVLTEVTVQPPVMTLFAGGALTHHLTVTDRRSTPLTVTAVECTPPQLTGTVLVRDRFREGPENTLVELRLSADCPDGRHEGMVTLRTDDPAYRELKVPITVVKRPRQSVAASPASVSLVTAPGQSNTSRIVLLRPAGTEAVRVESVQADDPALSCTWAEGPHNLATLKIAVQRLTQSGASSSSGASAVHVRLAAPARETITVPVRWTLE